jgi:hypothetical protein
LLFRTVYPEAICVFILPSEARALIGFLLYFVQCSYFSRRVQYFYQFTTRFHQAFGLFTLLIILA